MFNFYFLLSSIIFISLDFFYLKFMKNYFDNQIQKIQGTKITLNLFGALICYILLILGLNYFIIKQHKSISDAFLLGIVIYGVYETTNLALLKNWSLLTVFLDTLWGGILFALTTAIIYKLKTIF